MSKLTLQHHDEHEVLGVKILELEEDVAVVGDVERPEVLLVLLAAHPQRLAPALRVEHLIAVAGVTVGALELRQRDLQLDVGVDADRAAAVGVAAVTRVARAVQEELRAAPADAARSAHVATVLLKCGGDRCSKTL